jgi:hypothetical protein
MTKEDSIATSVLLVLPIEYATSVFINTNDNVVIEQPDPYGGDCSVIVLSKQQAEQVYLALQKFVEGC